MKISELHIKAHYFLALLIAFCLPFARMTSVFIVLFAINWLVEGDFKSKFQELTRNKLALLLISFYVLHVFGLLYSTNWVSGIFDLQVKLSLLIFPIILSTRPLTKTKVNHVFMALIAGAVVSSILILARALYLYLAFGENNFFYQALSVLIHPSYLSMYLNFAICWILISLFKRNNHGIPYFRILSYFVLLLFTLMVVLLSSKMGLLVMGLVYIGFLLYFIIARKMFLIGISGLVLFGTGVFLMMKFIPEVNGRISRAISAVTTTEVHLEDSESTAVRLLVWKAANQVIAEHFIFGTGIGDSKDALMKMYKEKGMTGAYASQLNTHNEFYQVFVSLGLIGFLIFVSSIIFPVFLSIKVKDLMYILFAFILILNFMAESMLETQAGTIFYAFFNAMLLFTPRNTNYSLN